MDYYSLLNHQIEYEKAKRKRRKKKTPWYEVMVQNSTHLPVKYPQTTSL